MAGTSVSTLSKVGSTSSVLETSFNYVWENLSDFYDICGETVKWCPIFFDTCLKKMMGTVEVEDIEVGSLE